MLHLPFLFMNRTVFGFRDVITDDLPSFLELLFAVGNRNDAGFFGAFLWWWWCWCWCAAGFTVCTCDVIRSFDDVTSQ